MFGIHNRDAATPFAAAATLIVAAIGKDSVHYTS